MKNCLLLLFITTSLFAQTQLPFGQNPQVGKYASIRGFNMYYESYGSGEPLLLIHGNSGSIADFSNQIPFFSQHYRVIVADNRSHGKSIDTQDSLSYEMMADDFAGLLDHLKIDSANVIGWSDGGINGLLLASRHPKKVKKLAVTGANLTPDAGVSVDPWVVENENHYVDSLSHLPASLENKRLIKLHHMMQVQPQIRPSVLAKIQCPTLVIGGDHDVIVPRHTLEIAELIPKSYLWILPNSGHSTPIYYKDLFNSTVLDFLKSPYRKIEKMAKFF
jgi:pimeloyl-ACP methyl ester carboxylesterase